MAALDAKARVSLLEWTQKYRQLRVGTQYQPFSFDGHEYLRELYSDPQTVMVMEKSAQCGCPLALDTPIPTPTGWTTMGDIQVGDQVFDEHGLPRSVVGVSDIFTGNDCYEIVFSDHSLVVCDAAHLWTVDDERSHRYPKHITLPAAQLASTLNPTPRKQKRNRYAIPVAESLCLPDAEFILSPYLLGLWLGNGNQASNQLTMFGPDADEVATYIEAEGHRALVRPDWDGKPNSKNIIIDQRYTVQDAGRMCMAKALDVLGLRNNKHIPVAYMRASREQRLLLLQGLMDTDGTIGKNGACEFGNTDEALLDQCYELLVSLGMKPVKSDRPPKQHEYNGRMIRGGASYRLKFMAYTDAPVFRVKRKLARMVDPDDTRRLSETRRRRIIAINPVPSVQTRCITVDSPSHLFLCGRAMIPTHNSEFAISFALWAIDTHLMTGIYIFPTDGDVEDFSNTRVKSIIEGCEHLSSQCTNINNVHLRQIGESLLYFRGMAAKNRVKSIPADFVILDELDESNPANKAQAVERMSHSPYQWRLELSTPTLPDYGIDIEFQHSDQRYWHVACGCHEGVILEDVFPDCIKIDNAGDVDEDVYLRCPKCGKERLDVCEPARVGEYTGWIPRMPENKEIRGYHLAQLFSVGAKYPERGVSMRKLWTTWKNTRDIPEFYNSKLGMPYAGDRMPLSYDVLNKCEGDWGLLQTGKKICIGVDQGDELHAVAIKVDRNTGQARIINAVIIDDTDPWPALAEWIRMYTDIVGVVDAMPDKNDARKLCMAFPNKFFMCYYSDTAKDAITADATHSVVMVGRQPNADPSKDKRTPQQRLDDGMKVVANRTETLDRVVDDFLKTARGDTNGLWLPDGQVPVVKVVKDHLTGMAKIKRAKTITVSGSRMETGEEEYVYVHTKPDHFAHAINYAMIASGLNIYTGWAGFV